MNTLLAIALTLSTSFDLHAHTKLYHHVNNLGVDRQITTTLSPVRVSDPVKVEIKGNGRGDLDCYLLKKNPQGEGWVIAAKDESNMDQCSFVYYPDTNKDLRLWVVNHGVHPTTYTADVEQ